MISRSVLTGALFLTLSTPVLAQDAKPPAMDHGSMGAMKAANGPAGDTDSPSSKAFIAANEKMHSAMATGLTGDPDVDFVRGMIPHHQGAIDMARIQLEYGKDSELRRLAQAIIEAQETEIAEMRTWLAAHDR